MRYVPSIRDVRDIIKDARTTQAGIQMPGLTGTYYVPARSVGFYSFGMRLRAAWLVFTGKADAVTYPGQP